MAKRSEAEKKKKKKKKSVQKIWQCSKSLARK